MREAGGRKEGALRLFRSLMKATMVGNREEISKETF